MILDPTDPIDLSWFFGVQRLSAELMYLDLPTGVSAFDHPTALEAIDRAGRDFPEAVADRVDREDEIRRGLCWLLHQPDEVLARIHRTGAHLVLASPSMVDQRRFLELLWGRTFADWRSKPLDPDLYGVLDLGASSELPVLVDAYLPIDFSVIFALLARPSGHLEVGALAGDEGQARLGLWWLLQQEDDVLGELLRRGGMVHPSPSIEDRRRSLERGWEEVFADWRVEGFDPGDYEVVGLPEEASAA